MHEAHEHQHNRSCGHYAVMHDGHQDYLHDGHLHFHNGTATLEHELLDDVGNPDHCTPDHFCGLHNRRHTHGSDCGHPAVPHAGHTDYWVDGHVHHTHRDHCDMHGRLLAA